jgi:glutaredoxin
VHFAVREILTKNKIVMKRKTESLLLYVKTGCPWCRMAEDYLRNRGYHYERVDVRQDRAGFDELKRISGQTLTPTLAWENSVLADFGPKDLEEFLEAHNVQPGCLEERTQ